MTLISNKNDVNFSIEKSSENTLKIIFSGSLSVDSVAELWNPCMAAVANYQPHLLVLNFKEVNYCDGAGIALIKILKKNQIKNKRNCIIDNLSSDLQDLLKCVDQQAYKAERGIAFYKNLPERVGYITADFLNSFHENIKFLGALSRQLFLVLIKSKTIRWSDFLRIAEETGPQALPIVALVGFLIGLISTFQAAPSFKQFGVQIYMVNLVGLGLVREMGPLLTSVLLSGRTASAFAAEIGTMKINQEIDALETMGINPILFLVVPRIIATMIMTPILEIFFIIFGLFGCMVVMSTLGYTIDAVVHQLHQAISPMSYFGGLIKVFVFGLVISAVGCLNGIKTSFGAKAVGHSTTQAVVSSLIMLIIVDGIFALIYYVLGI